MNDGVKACSSHKLGMAHLQKVTVPLMSSAYWRSNWWVFSWHLWLSLTLWYRSIILKTSAMERKMYTIKFPVSSLLSSETWKWKHQTKSQRLFEKWLCVQTPYLFFTFSHSISRLQSAWLFNKLSGGALTPPSLSGQSLLMFCMGQRRLHGDGIYLPRCYNASGCVFVWSRWASNKKQLPCFKLLWHTKILHAIEHVRDISVSNRAACEVGFSLAFLGFLCPSPPVSPGTILGVMMSLQGPCVWTLGLQ